MTINSVKESISASIKVKTKLLNDDRLMSQIVDLASRCAESLEIGGKIIFCGNGGSFADAQHLSAEFTSRFLFDRPGLASIALGTNSSAMTAIGNDYGYENVFSREIEAIANPADILIAITTSGNSSNILKGIPNNTDFYFVHNFAYHSINDKYIIAETNYDINFPAIIKKKHIWGTQFHPEKSSKWGLKIIKNFLEN